MRRSDEVMRVAVVDDDRADARLVERALSKMELNYELRHTLNGRAFLDSLDVESSWYPDLVLLDLNMPILNGWETLSKLKVNEAHAGMSVVVLSTTKAPSDVSSCLELGAKAFISKDDSLSSFTKQVQSIVLNNWRH